MAKRTLLLLLLSVIAISFAPRVAAFGAGNIPSYSYLEGKAFRHGDIDDVLGTLWKTAGGGFLGRGKRFSPLDTSRTYFGSWLRDYSQAVDVGALQKTNLTTILNLVMVLGFLGFGYATAEFEVTKERLGCYLPVEHIDNPKGYADGQDARQYDPRLRGPVDPKELEIDPRTGMKRYIRDESGHWDTSSAYIRRVLKQCIHFGRLFKANDRNEDQYEAFRLLGTALHVLEDYMAHSSFCENALISFGCHDVFPHVGRNVKVRAPNGKMVYPIVTGTFGGADFIFSLMGEGTDKLSEASVSDLSKRMTNARSIQEGQSSSAGMLRQLFFDLPGGTGGDLSRDMDNITNMRAGQPGGMDPSTMTPQELHATLWQILSFRDSVMKKIENTIDKIPGLAGLVEKISNSISVFIITTLEPFVKPLIATATGALGQTSQSVIDSHDQLEVWNDWNASDPTHSRLSKDHFDLILNEPAGEVAKVITEYTVNAIVRAWDDTSIDPDHVITDILACLFHPDFYDGHSQIQKMMLDKMHQWFNGLGHDKAEVIRRLNSDNVKANQNKRLGAKTQGQGHVHNTMLPDGGLQQALAQHNVHVPGAQVLNAGQDLMSGKMPWQQGFGSGGQHAWRDMDGSEPNFVPSVTASHDQVVPNYPPAQQSFEPPQQSYEPTYEGYGSQPPSDSYPGQFNPQQPPEPTFDAGQQNYYESAPYNPADYERGGYGQGGYTGPPPQQPSYDAGFQGGFSGPPPPGYGGQPQWGPQGEFQGGPPRMDSGRLRHHTVGRLTKVTALLEGGGERQ
ncbi:putative heterokaryon incompatibility protein HET-C [Naematelia encephala]|uniref:Putative heterokaryon incompatibility protein HET-C n=1 Tax=Naematelia encephala TaxID=71784 RepID=A0A1Y2AJS0_9TREE|nr:putative heterokaryon incompatibility protein HET-C [Naematelia encephala]